MLFAGWEVRMVKTVTVTVFHHTDRSLAGK